MSGHSKWSTIRRKKEKVDAQRGKIFSKLIKELTVAARIGGGDPDGNPRLRAAILAAKSANMPAENIDRAIKKGTGELPGITFEETQYEGYGPGGVAILVEVATDNKNRTTSEIRHLFSKNGGTLGAQGCVAWMFDSRGVIIIDENKYDEDTIISLALEAGADDVKTEDGAYEIVTQVTNFEKVKNVFAENNVVYESAELTKVPQSFIKLEGKQAEQMLRLITSVEEHDDVQHVYANFDIPQEIMEKIQT